MHFVPVNSIWPKQPLVTEAASSRTCSLYSLGLSELQPSMTFVKPLMPSIAMQRFAKESVSQLVGGPLRRALNQAPLLGGFRIFSGCMV